MLPNDVQKARLVVLAADPLEQLWPVSTPQCPYTFVAGDDGYSPFERLLKTCVGIFNNCPPIVVTLPCALDVARNQASRALPTNTDFIVVPPGTSIGIQATLASAIAARSARDQNLVFLPATLDVTDNAEAHAAILALGASLTGSKARAHLLGHISPVIANMPAIVLQNKATMPGWQTVQRVFLPSNSDDPQDVELRQLQSIAVPNGAAAAQASTLLEMLHKASPINLQACNNALTLAETPAADITIPKASFLSLTADLDIAQIMQAHHNQLAVRIVSRAVRAITNWDDKRAQRPQIMSGKNVVAIAKSAERLERISYGGNTLILEPGEGSKVSFPKDQGTSQSPGNQPENASPQDVAYRNIGTFLDRDVWQVTIQPGVSTAPECHFRRCEQWLVVDGEGECHIEDEIIAAKAGVIIDLPEGKFHFLVNNGHRPLQIIETRSGLIRDEDDRIIVANALSNAEAPGLTPALDGEVKTA